MSGAELKSAELAKELGVKATEVVSALAKIRNTEFKKGTTNIKITTSEAEQIREIFAKPAKQTPLQPEAPSPKTQDTKPEAPVLEAKPQDTKPVELPKEQTTTKEEPPQAETAKVQKAPAPSTEPQPTEEPAEEELLPKDEIPVDDEIELIDRFKKDIEVEKVEKIKAKPSLHKAFQTIKKIEPKKWQDTKSFGKKPKDHKGKQPEVIEPPAITAPRKKSIKLEEGTTVKAFAELIGQKVSDVIKKFMELGYMANLNQPVDMDAAILVADMFGVKVESVTAVQLDVVEEIPDDEASLVTRPPVVTIMGHVDHGKTSLLDAIRQTKVTETEAGGITQHIGAYKVTLQGKDITFLDTPGHEAFTALRARGAKVTDIVVLVVAADDGVMPQTVEAINHAKAANVPIVVAVNKIDKPEANPTRVRNELAEYGVIPEEWGGQNIFVEVSAKKKLNIEHLLEMILLQAEVLDLKANPNKPARGTVIEARLDKGRGPVATVLIQAGTLKPGDAFVAGTASGRVRALISDEGKKLSSAGPSTPVEVLGFSEVPLAGDVFNVVEDEKKARQIALARAQKQRLASMSKLRKLTLDELYSKIKDGQIKELNLIIKGDVQGSVEALKKSLEDITHPEVKVKVIHASVGAIKESDVTLASASNAIIMGFNVRPEPKASQIADKEGVDIRLYNIIYVAIEDVKKALAGMLSPTLKEKILGRAEVRQTYHVSRLGTIAGCYVTDGHISRASDGIRVIRDNIVVYEGKIASLKRFKDDVREVQSGYECGLMVANFNDIKEGDILENFIIEKIAAEL